MRYVDFKLVHQPAQLNEGYTAGDLAETVWGAGVAAAFANYPEPATENDIIEFISGLQQEGKNQYNFVKTRDDGLKSSLSDTVIFANTINMKAHVADLQDIKSSIEKIRKEIDAGLISNANGQVEEAGLALKEIFANGKADTITIGAVGGADQKGTKIDVSIVWKDTEGETVQKNLGYSLKTDTSATGKMPVGQAQGVDKGAGGQVQFFADLGVIDNIDEASIDDYNKMNDTLREYISKNVKDGVLDKVYEKEAQRIRLGNEGRSRFIQNAKIAASQINSRVNSDTEEGAFFDDLVKFLQKHVNKNEPGIKLLTFDKNGAYTTTVEKFSENRDNFTIRAEVNEKSGILNIFAIGKNGKKALILELRFKQSGGRFSASTYRKAVEAGKDNPDGYELLRYTITIVTGKGYRQFAEI